MNITQTEYTAADGEKYISKPELFKPSCEGCCTYNDSPLCNELPPCKDEKSGGIIWVKNS